MLAHLSRRSRMHTLVLLTSIEGKASSVDFLDVLSRSPGSQACDGAAWASVTARGLRSRTRATGDTAEQKAASRDAPCWPEIRSTYFTQ
jgi:hypothetical protein